MDTGTTKRYPLSTDCMQRKGGVILNLARKAVLLFPGSGFLVNAGRERFLCSSLALRMFVLLGVYLYATKKTFHRAVEAVSCEKEETRETLDVLSLSYISEVL